VKRRGEIKKSTETGEGSGCPPDRQWTQEGKSMGKVGTTWGGPGRGWRERRKVVTYKKSSMRGRGAEKMLR